VLVDDSQSEFSWLLLSRGSRITLKLLLFDSESSCTHQLVLVVMLLLESNYPDLLLIDKL
jgi:hypothetical protein